MDKYCLTINTMAHRKKYDRKNQGQWHRMLIGIEPCYPTLFYYYNSNGVLIWKGTGFPTNVNCDHLAVTYRDLKIPVCGSSFKIFRRRESVLDVNSFEQSE